MTSKRILAFVLSLCMMLTIASFPAMAEEVSIEDTSAEILLDADFLETDAEIDIGTSVIEEGETVTVKLENVDTKDYSLSVADYNDFLQIGNVVIDAGKKNGFIAFEITAPKGTAGKLANVAIAHRPTAEALEDDPDRKFFYTNFTLYVEDPVDPEVPEIREEIYAGISEIEVGKTIPVKLENVNTKDYTITIADSNGFLQIGNVVIDAGKENGFVAFEITAPKGTAGKIAYITITYTPTAEALEANGDLKVVHSSFTLFVVGSAVPVAPAKPPVVEELVGGGNFYVDSLNNATVYLEYYEEGISAEVYNYLKDQQYESITLVSDMYTWTIEKGDYTTMNVTADIYFAVTVDTKLWKEDKYGEVVEDLAMENAAMKAIYSFLAVPLYVTISDGTNIGNVARNPQLTFSVPYSWIYDNNKFDVVGYKFDGETATKVFDGLAVKPATGKMTVTGITSAGIYILVGDNEEEITDEYCPGFPHEYDDDSDTTCNKCGYIRTVLSGSDTAEGGNGAPMAPKVVEDLEGGINWYINELDNTTVVEMHDGYVGISASVYNELKNRQYESITFVGDSYTWTIKKGDYTMMNVAATIYFAVDVDTNLWTTNEDYAVVQDVARENSVRAALGNAEADPFYVTIHEYFNLTSLATKPQLTIDVPSYWTNYNSRYNVSCYLFNDKVVKRVATGLKVQSATSNLSIDTIREGGLYVFVDGSVINDDCKAYTHTYDDDYDRNCNVCGYTRTLTNLPTFVAESKKARIGETFTVAVSTRDNAGIVSLKLKVGYDADVLELVSIEEADFADATFGAIGKNPITVLWEDVLNENNTTDGTVALLTFKVKETATLGNTEITLTYNPEDVYDFGMNNVEFEVENGVINVVNYTSGDVNNDGEVNNKDLGILRRYLNEWEVEILEVAADVNRDGAVNNKDLGILRRYLNDWDVELK